MTVSTAPPEVDRLMRLVVRHLNASVPDPISTGELIHVLRTNQVPEHRREHVFAFFDETEVETLSDLVRAGAVTYADLRAGALRELPPAHETRRWIVERS